MSNKLSPQCCGHCDLRKAAQRRPHSKRYRKRRQHKTRDGQCHETTARSHRSFSEQASRSICSFCPECNDPGSQTVGQGVEAEHQNEVVSARLAPEQQYHAQDERQRRTRQEQPPIGGEHGKHDAAASKKYQIKATGAFIK